MSSYEQIEGFEYWNKEAWKKFVNDYILPLYISSSKLLKLREEIILRTQGKKLSNLEDDLLKFLLGGINEEGDYENNSLALFTKNAFGIYTDPKQYVALEKEGINSLEYVKVEVSTETEFVKFLKDTSSLSSQIVSKVGLETTEVKEVEELIKEPDKILEVLRELYEKVLQVTANYNYYTFFTISTRNLPFFYLTKAYPKLKEKFDEMKEFLSFREIYKPETEVQKIKEECTVWGQEKGGLSYLIFTLNNLIWWNIRPNSSLLPIFNFVSQSFKDLKKEYLKKVEEELKLMGWKLQEFFNYCYGCSVSFDVSGIVTRNWLNKELQRYEGKSLLEVLNDFSPALFLGYLNVSGVSSNRISLRKVE